MNFKTKERAASFEDLISKAPVNSLQEVLNYILPFYNFKNAPEKSLDPLLSYHFNHLTLTFAKVRPVLLSELNVIEQLGNFKCVFLEFELGHGKGEKSFVRHTVDVSTQLVVASEAAKPGEHPEITGPLVIDHQSFHDFFEEKFKSKNLKKHFALKQRGGVFEFAFTVKLFQKTVNQSCEFNSIGKIDLKSKKITSLFRFEAYFSTEDSSLAQTTINTSGNRFLHKKTFDVEISSVDQPSILSEIGFLQDRYFYSIKGMCTEAEKVFEMIRLIAPITKEGTNWDQSRSLKNLLMEDIKNAKKGK